MCPGTLRENTERPITIEQGTNRLAGVHPEAILKADLEVRETEPRPAAAPPRWDGQASWRVVDVPAQGRDAVVCHKTAACNARLRGLIRLAN